MFNERSNTNPFCRTMQQLSVTISLFKTDPSTLVKLISITEAFVNSARWSISSFFEILLTLKWIKCIPLFLNIRHLIPLFVISLSKVVFSPANRKITITKRKVIPHLLSIIMTGPQFKLRSPAGITISWKYDLYLCKWVLDRA